MGPLITMSETQQSEILSLAILPKTYFHTVNSALHACLVEQTLS